MRTIRKVMAIVMLVGLPFIAIMEGVGFKAAWREWKECIWTWATQGDTTP